MDQDQDYDFYLDLLGEVGAIYSHDPLEMFVIPALVRNEELLATFFRLPTKILPQHKKDLVVRGIAAAGVEVPAEDVSRRSVDDPKKILRLFGEAMTLSDFLKLEEATRINILATVSHEVRVPIEVQQPPHPHAPHLPAAVDPPRRSRFISPTTIVELMLMLAIIVIKIPTTIIVNAGSYQKAGMTTDMAITEALGVLPKWVAISSILDPLLTAAVTCLAFLLGSAFHEKDKGEHAAEVGGLVRQQQEGLLAEVEGLVRQQQGGEGAAPANP